MTQPEAFRYTCLICGAKPGRPCKEISGTEYGSWSDGKRVLRIHSARIDIAAQRNAVRRAS